MKATILIVDDEPQLVRALRINLQARRYDVITAGDGTTALRAAAEQHPDVVVLDLGLPDIDGLEVLRSLRGWTKKRINKPSEPIGGRPPTVRWSNDFRHRSFVLCHWWRTESPSRLTRAPMTND